MSAAGAERAGTAAFAGTAAACLGAVAAALVSQHVFGMEPCPWCVLQRVILVAIAVVAMVGALLRSRSSRRGAAMVAFLLAICGAGAALWQHFRAAASASCNLTLADRIVSALRLDTTLPAVFEPRASCADAAVKLLGVSYDLWSLALFALLAVASAWLAAAPGRRRR